MIRSGWLVLGVSLLAGASATLLAAGWLGTQRSAPMTNVVVAGRDIEAGQTLDGASLQTVDWPSSALPPGYRGDPTSLVGRVVRTALVQGEPVLIAKLAPEGVKGGLAAVISPGRRAMTVRVNEVVGVAGFALPGNHVDVLVNAQEGGDAGQAMSRIVLERILVLAVAQEAGRDEVRPRVVSAVTLEVTPQQAEMLDLARAVGQLSLVLRNQTDNARGGSIGIKRAELLGTTPPAVVNLPDKSSPRVVTLAPRAAEPKPARSVSEPAVPSVQIEVIRGVLKSSAGWPVTE